MQQNIRNKSISSIIIRREAEETHQKKKQNIQQPHLLIKESTINIHFRSGMRRNKDTKNEGSLAQIGTFKQ